MVSGFESLDEGAKDRLRVWAARLVGDARKARDGEFEEALVDADGARRVLSCVMRAAF